MTLNVNKQLAGSASWLMSGYGPKIHLAPEDGGGADGGGDDAAKIAADKAAADEAAKKAAADKAAADKAGGDKPSDKEAALLKDVMAKKAKLEESDKALKEAKDRLKEFDGIDPAEVKKLLTAQKDAEKAQLEAKGDFDRLKAMMADEHAKELKKHVDENAALKDSLAQRDATINDLLVGTAFSSSPYVANDLVLTPAKARTVYGTHFAIEDGVVVAYDKPASAKERTKLVNSSGVPVGFEDAIKKLVDADPDRERLLKTKLKDGAGSKTDQTKLTEPKGAQGLSRIRAVLSAK